ncbi:MAG: GNAT family N-acetyltransferase [Nitrososphaerales archaeon]
MEKFKGDAVLKDGSLVHVRRTTGNDREVLSEFFGGLSEESILSRFLKPMIDKESLLDELLAPDRRFSLLAIRDGKVVGEADYSSGSEPSEMGVSIADGFHRKGLGSILLGQLAQAAADSGITTFTAATAAETHYSLNFVRNLGFPVQMHAAPGCVRVTFPTSMQPAGLAAFERREADSAVAAGRRLLEARSIAVIGASRDPMAIGGALFRNIIEADFKGLVYPVNRDAAVVQSVAAYKSVLDCPDPVDLAFIVVPARFVVSTAKECAQKGVKAVVVISSGFSEIGGDGVRLQEELVKVCRESGMRLVGPNCMGIINTKPEVSLNGQFAPPRSIPGRIGFLSQSGSLGYAIIDQANKLGLGMSSFVSVGNKADISSNDMIQYWESDKDTDVILLHLESFGNPRKFARLAKRVARKKPIVVVKSGRSAAGFRATQSHTGALVAASDVTVDALFKQSGIIRTDSLEEMFDVAAFLSTQPVPKGNRVAIITNAGGPAILAADACESLDLHVPELSGQTRAELAKFLLPIAGTKNPVDMTSVAQAADYANAIHVVSNDPSVDALIVVFIPPMAVKTEDVAAAIIKATRELKRRIPVMTIFMATKGVSGQLSDGVVQIPSYPFPELAAQALAQAVNYGRWVATPPGSLREFPEVKKLQAAALVSKALANKKSWLDPASTSALLGCYGIPMVRTVEAGDPVQAARAATEFPGRVVLKASAPGLLHKTELDAVKVGLEPRDVEAAGKKMGARLEKNGVSGVSFLVQDMVSEAVEMFVGVTNDPNFGPLLACGIGGALVELLRDVSVRLTPLTDVDAHQMVRSLRTFPVLDGYRGEPKHDVKALEEVMLRLSQLVEDIPEVAELDLNPVMVLLDGKGAVVVDARVRVAESAPQLPIGAKKR